MFSLDTAGGGVQGASSTESTSKNAGRDLVDKAQINPNNIYNPITVVSPAVNFGGIVKMLQGPSSNGGLGNLTPDFWQDIFGSEEKPASNLVAAPKPQFNPMWLLVLVFSLIGIVFVARGTS